MRPTHLLLLGAVALTTAARPTHAQQAAVGFQLATLLFDAGPAPDSSRVDQVLADADQATAAGRLSAARRMYQGLISEQRDAQQYAGKALWRLASVNVFDGNKRAGAMVLDELAAEAARFGDPTMELRASFEAAVLWQQVKRHDLSRRNLERVHSLLQSPAIAADVKEGIQSRIVD